MDVEVPKTLESVGGMPVVLPPRGREGKEGKLSLAEQNNHHTTVRGEGGAKRSKAKLSKQVVVTPLPG